MILLTVRTDKPESEIGLYSDTEQLAYETWQAHRQLAETLHVKIKALLESQKLDWSDIQGIVVYKGPGSFTGLRIGLAIANALAASNNLPIAGSTGDNWITEGTKALQDGTTDSMVLPEYGAAVHITAQKK